jgi:hypothetical protein
MSLPQRPPLLTSALVMTAGICWIALILLVLQPLPLFDLTTPLERAAEWTRGADPYHAALLDPTSLAASGSGFIYPPYALPFFAAMELARPVSIVAWQLVQLAALAWLVWDLAQPRSARRVAALAILAVFFYPAITNLVLGQAGLMTVAAAWFSLRLLQRSRNLAGGLVIGAAGLLKFFPLLMVALLALSRRWWAVVGSAVTLVAAIMLTLPLTGGLWPEYLSRVLVSRATSQTAFPTSQSLGAAITRLLVANPYEQSFADAPVLAHLVGLAAAMCLFALTILVCWRVRTSNPALGWATLLAMLPLIIPYSWQHYDVLTIPLLWLVGSAAVARRDPWLGAASILAFLGLSVLAETVDHAALPVNGWPPVLQALYINGSVIGALALLLGAFRLARPIASAERLQSKAA